MIMRRETSVIGGVRIHVLLLTQRVTTCTDGVLSTYPQHDTPNRLYIDIEP